MSPGTQIIIKKANINNVPVWFYIQELQCHDPSSRELISAKEFLCYFKFSEPTSLIWGEVVKDIKKLPILFNDQEEAIIIGMNYVKQLFKL